MRPNRHPKRHPYRRLNNVGHPSLCVQWNLKKMCHDLFQAVVFGGLVAALAISSVAVATPVQSTNVVHTQAYKKHPERGPYISIIVTPPSARGVDGRVLVEVYNYTKINLALVKFDINLRNSGGFDINAVAEANSLKPKSSGAIWVKLPKIKDRFPPVTAATIDGFRVINSEAQEVSVRPYLTVISK